MIIATSLGRGHRHLSEDPEIARRAHEAIMLTASAERTPRFPATMSVMPQADRRVGLDRRDAWWKRRNGRWSMHGMLPWHVAAGAESTKPWEEHGNRRVEANTSRGAEASGSVFLDRLDYSRDCERRMSVWAECI